MTITRLLACDPGISGAAALLTKDGSFSIKVVDIPICRIDNNNAIDGRSWQKIIREWKPDIAYFELTWAIPTRAIRGENMKGQGVVAAGRTQRAHGVLEGILECELEPGKLIYTIPRSWKKRFGLIGGLANKQKSTEMALEFFPEMAESLRRKKDHNRSEAILLAIYGSEKQGLLKIAQA